jgi:hypothetical protein
MKFLVPNYSCLQNPWLAGYNPQIPCLSLLGPQLPLLNPPPEQFLDTPLDKRVFFRQNFRSALGTTQPPVLWTPCLLSGGKADGAWRWLPTSKYKPRLKKEYIYASSPRLGLHGPFQGELYLILHPLTQWVNIGTPCVLAICSDLVSRYVLSLAWGKTRSFLMLQNVAL